MSAFDWNARKSQAAIQLASGYTQVEVAAELGVTDRTLRRWMDHEEFAAEVDRLSLMLDIAGRAQRLRIAMRMARAKGEKSDRDLLDWLKFAQSETDGVKLDLAKLAAAFGADEAPVAGSGSDRPGGREPSAPEAAVVAPEPAPGPAADQTGA